jgi:hypothetical protein
MNRIIIAIDRMEKQVASKGLSQEKLNQISTTLNMDLEEYVIFQTEKNIAMMKSKLTLDETQTIYSYLGETLEHFNQNPVHVKAVLTKVLAELLGARIASRR